MGARKDSACVKAVLDGLFKKAALERLPLYYAISSSQVFSSSTEAWGSKRFWPINSASGAESFKNLQLKVTGLPPDVAKRAMRFPLVSIDSKNEFTNVGAFPHQMGKPTKMVS